MLFDAGDTIQGTALADYQALVKPVGCDEELAIYRAMDALGYDGGTIGNHEFNYGLPFLAQVTNRQMNVDGIETRHCKGPSYPLVLSNVFSKRDDKPIYAPYAIVEKKLKIKAADGREIEAPIRIGIIGFTPPKIMQWDKRNLDGKVYTKGLVESRARVRAETPRRERRPRDRDLARRHRRVAVRHDDGERELVSRRASPASTCCCSAIRTRRFPIRAQGEMRTTRHSAGSRQQRGFVHGKPAVMGNYWGKSLGVIELALVRREGHWQIDAASTHSEVRNVKKADGTFVEPRAASPRSSSPCTKRRSQYVIDADRRQRFRDDDVLRRHRRSDARCNRSTRRSANM